MLIRRVLVIDDEPAIRDVIELTLSLIGGWDVLTAGSGRDGLRQAREHVPDLILLDVMMPDMDGPETLQALQEHPATSGIPVIFMTAASRHDPTMISKPFDPETLIERILKMVDDMPAAPVPDAPESNLERQLAALWESHECDTMSSCDVLRQAASLEQQGSLDDQTRAAAVQSAHGLAGTAGLFGFSEAALTCKVLQRAFEEDDAAPAGLVEMVDFVRGEFGKGMAHARASN